MSVVKFVWAMRYYFRLAAGQILLGSLAGLAKNSLTILPPIALGGMIDAVLDFRRGSINLGELTRAAVWVFLATALTEIPRIGKRWWFATSNARLMANLRVDALKGILAWPLAKLSRTPVGDFMARIIGDVEVLGRGTGELTREAWDTLWFSGALVAAMLVYDVPMALLGLAPVPVAMVLAHAAGRWVQERTIAARAANAALTGYLQEQLVGVRVLRLFGRTKDATDQADSLSQSQRRASLATIRVERGLVPVYNTLMVAGVVFVVWLGTRNVLSGEMPLGSLVAFILLYRKFVDRGFRVPAMLNRLQGGAAAYTRLSPLLAPPVRADQEPTLASFRANRVAAVDEPVPPPAPAAGRALPVIISSVHFRYPGSPEPQLRGIDLELPAGSLVAVTGPVGSGKSALARAILGLYPLDSGSILLDGVDVAEFPPDRRAAMCGYLPQEPFVFSGTVAENIMLGMTIDDESRERVADSVAAAGLTREVADFPEGLNTAIGEMGVRVSGGQRLRIALARAMASGAESGPGLLVLDDPFSAVDVDTEAHIIEELRRRFGPAAPAEKRSTVVVFSHRLAAFSRADLVVVLRNGAVEEKGTHEELITGKGLYSRIYRAQRRATGDGDHGRASP